PFAPGASGNAATEDVIHMLHEMGISTGIDLDKIISAADELQKWIGHDTDSSILRACRCAERTDQTDPKKINVIQRHS
ncbi:MAG: hypothetical protein PHO18_07110, partial [Synergistaceae bacterium]|nr:hypothetical protein [Synergistaceae bacterium]